MKDLVKQYLDQGLSRRQFLSGLGRAGLSSAAATTMANSLAPFVAQAQSTDGARAWMREMKGTGAALLVAQLKAAGVRHLFCNPSGAVGPFFDALVDEPELHIIKALEEGTLGAMSDGYAKASGKPAFAMIDAAGLPAFMGQMYISSVDRMPVVVAVDDNQIPNVTNGITKWQWIAERPDTLPAVARQALKFATTDPCGPVFLVLDGATLRNEGQAGIMDKEKFDVPVTARPDPALVQQAARMLLEAKNPLVFVGDEVTWCRAESELLELAELVGAIVTEAGSVAMWSKPFPTRHHLYRNQIRQTSDFPGEPDVVLSLGSRSRPPANPRAKRIDVRLDPTRGHYSAGDPIAAAANALANTTPVDVGIIADLKVTLADLLSALRGMATPARLKQISEPRIARAKENRAQLDNMRMSLAKAELNRRPLSMARIAFELENVLEKDTAIVENKDGGNEALCHTFMNIGGNNKRWFSQTAVVLGWGVSAAFGVKLARPDLPVVAIVGDGEFMFRGPQPLWSYARYNAPVTVVIENNHSYDTERNRLWLNGGRQFETGRDMICYNGDPDIDFAKMADSVGVEGETVMDPASVRPALERAKRANADGRPYVLDVHTERSGVGAQSSWHPPYSMAAQRARRV
jgi:thiamine pyrophosphate-dependent acetolactate synthase large subunit-like protein